MSIDYSDLLTKIQNQKCALVLGPNVCLADDCQTPFGLKVAKEIIATGKPIKYYRQEDLYYIPSRTDRTWTCNFIQDKEREVIADMTNPGFCKNLFQQLTEIPFHLILSLTPDKFLFQTMKQQGLNPQFACFSISAPTQSFECPTLEKPLVFNLFGETNKAESLILTQEDFYKYLYEVFTNPKKLENLRTCLHDIDHLIFLGCPLERWYVRLLMLLLEVNSDSRYIALATNPKRDDLQRCPPPQADDPEILEFEDFCSKHFKIVFAKDNFLNFINALHGEAIRLSNLPNPTISLRTQPLNLCSQADLNDVKRSVAISYAPDEKSVEVAAKITQAFSSKGYEVLNEKISLSYRGNVQDFINKMGSGQAVVIILSDTYLKNKNCMSLALTVEEHKNLTERIFPVVLADANIYDAVNLIRYRNFWQTKIDELNGEFRTIHDLAYTTNINKELNLYSEIKRFIDQFMGIVANMNVLTPDIHMGENFTTLINDVEGLFHRDP